MILFKGNLKLFILKELSRKDMSGYELMVSIGVLIGKRPSTGSIYPILETLNKEGLVSCRAEGRSKMYSMTEKGKSLTRECLCKHEEIHEKFNQLFNIACSLLDDKEVKKLRYMMDTFHEGHRAHELHFEDISKDVIDLKFNLCRILKEGDRQQVVKSRDIINRASADIKRLYDNGQ